MCKALGSISVPPEEGRRKKEEGRRRRRKKTPKKTKKQIWVPVILATQQADLRRISLQIVYKTLSPK
jgi:hypothetical protein